MQISLVVEALLTWLKQDINNLGCLVSNKAFYTGSGGEFTEEVKDHLAKHSEHEGRERKQGWVVLTWSRDGLKEWNNPRQHRAETARDLDSVTQRTVREAELTFNVVLYSNRDSWIENLEEYYYVSDLRGHDIEYGFTQAEIDTTFDMKITSFNVDSFSQLSGNERAVFSLGLTIGTAFNVVSMNDPIVGTTIKEINCDIYNMEGVELERIQIIS